MSCRYLSIDKKACLYSLPGIPHYKEYKILIWQSSRLLHS